ncbi:MAG: 23S rRNA (uracil(1939)-C(5))-methyltransferase RlmD [Synergistaceae bacterium]|nr:23S rRNA (uracil(1939)-C(5))-methyltransferase RlmD [Synergistaceae bacterium]
MISQGDTAEIEIRALSSQGDGIGELPDGLSVFVPNLLPGERALVRLVRVKRSYGTGKVLSRIHTVDDRTPSACPWYGRCGGCQLQHASYPRQLILKKALLKDSLIRLGHFSTEDLPIADCVPSPQNWGYRNKASFPIRSLRGKVTLGFFRRDSHSLVPITCCPLIDPSLEKLMVQLQADLPGLGLEGYDEKTHSGDLRHLVLRRSHHSGEGAVLFVFRQEPLPKQLSSLRALARRTRSSFPEFDSWAVNVQPEPGNAILGPRTRPLSGSPFFEERLGEHRLRLDGTSFFQVNTLQAQNLYRHILNWLDEKKESPLLELYSGVGSLTLSLARTGRHVISVESWPPACHNLKHNLAQNKVTNVSCYEGRAEAFFRQPSTDAYGTVVLDPPRGGCAKEVLEGLISAAPKRIIYVSCNPATLSRDLRFLIEGGYSILSLTPFDLFPQTAHVETVAVLEAN